MAASLTDIYSAIMSGIQSMNALNITLQSFFPRVAASSSQVPQTTGTISFTSSEVQGFMLVQTSSGVTVKIPYYSNP